MRWATVLAAFVLAWGQEKPGGVDLLQFIDPSRDIVLGDWKISNGALLSPMGPPWARVHIPYVPPTEYDLTLVVERKEGTSSLEVGLASDGRQFHVGIDGWGTGDIAGLCLIDGRANNENATRFQGKLLPKDTKAKIVCSVRRTGVAASVDGKSIFDWKGDLSRLSIGFTWEVPARSTLFIGSYNTRFLIHQATLEPVTGAGRAIRSWDGEVELLPRIDPGFHAVAGTWTAEDGVLRSPAAEDKGIASLVLPYLAPGEYDLGVVVERRGGTGSLLVGFPAEGKVRTVAVDDGFTDGGSTTLTFRVRKETIVVARDGKEVRSLRVGDPQLAPPEGFVGRGENTIALGAQGAGFAVHRITVTPRSGAGVLLRALDPTPFLKAGEAKLKANDPREAMVEFAKAMGADPAAARAWNGRGLSRKAVGELPSAREDLARAAELGWRDPVILINRGTQAFEDGDLETALADATRAMIFANQEAPGWYLKGRVLHARGEMSVAKVHLEQAIKFDPGLVDAYLLRGIEKMDLKDPKGALSDFDKAIELKGSFVEAYARRAKVKILLRDREGADADVSKALELNPGYSPAYQLRASGKYEIGDTAGALDDCAKALKLDPNYVWTWQTIAYTQKHLGDFPSALKAFDRAIELDPGKWFRWSHRAAVRRALGDTAGALEDYAKSLEILPSAAVTFERAGFRRDLGDLDGALSDADEVVRKNPNGAGRYHLRASILADRGEFEKAEQDLTRSIGLSPGTSLYYRARAQVRLRLRNVMGANEDLNKSIQLGTGERDANHEERAFVREYLGDSRGARGDAWWAVFYGERHGHGVGGLEMIRRLEMDR